MFHTKSFLDASRTSRVRTGTLAIISATLLSFLGPRSAHADSPACRHNVVSVGAAFGDPTALDLKIWTGYGSGFDFGVGFNRFSERAGVYGEYELGLANFWIGRSVQSVFYIGIGGAIGLRHGNDDLSVAMVIPIGLNFRFRIPLEMFIEARPGIALLDNSGFGIGGQLGIRAVF